MRKSTIRQSRMGKKVKTVIKTTDPSHVSSVRMAQVYMGNNTKPLPVSKVKYKANLKNGVVKVKRVDYSPAEYNGEQTRSVTMKKKFFKK